MYTMLKMSEQPVGFDVCLPESLWQMLDEKEH